MEIRREGDEGTEGWVLPFVTCGMGDQVVAEELVG